MYNHTPLDEEKLTELLHIANRVASIMHFGQLDKVGAPYIQHVVRVSESRYLIDDVDRIIARLHDIVEDTPITVEWIRERFGDEIAECVDNVTKRDGEDTVDYFKRVNSSLRSARVKFSDTTDNLNRDRTGLDEATCTRLDNKYAKYLEMNTYKGDV
jgi:(p)ppGpp synthase/HD superfamily hydrolase